MKRLIETDDGGFEAMIGEKVLLMCGVYFYTGKLSGVNEDHVELTDPQIVLCTGDMSSGPWTEAESLPSPWRVMKQGIESWGAAKC